VAPGWPRGLTTCAFASAVWSLPDDRGAELVCAAIVLRPGATRPPVDDRRAHVDGALIGAKQPRVVVQVDALPRTDATGQVRRRRLRDQIVAERSP
jgi:acyl-CoA synthetase (AMP-forming)/AMP-acid ligase II